MSDQERSAELGISLRTLARVASSILAVGLLATAQARADAVADFYRGKQLNLIVGYGTGGGYDVTPG
jgi:tripartite-type tricarboxylate transporter receptor subunit TctC